MAVGDEGGRVGGSVGADGRARGRCQERRQGQEVAGPGRTVGDEGEDLGDEALLYARVLERGVLGWCASQGKKRSCLETHQLCVELGQAGLALAIKDQKRVDHGERSEGGA